MKARNLFLAIGSAVLLTSCVGLHSLSSSDIANAPGVSLSQNNFHVVKHVSSTAKTKYICGIGGFSQKALKQNAVADMITKANLVGSQTIVNITTKTTRRCITPLYIEQYVTAQGTVVEFDNPSFGYTVSLTEVEKDKVANNEPYIYPSTTPLGLCVSGDIKDLSKNEQKAVLGMLVDELGNDMRNARSLADLEKTAKNIEMVKTYYGLMSNGTQKDVTKLAESLNKKLAKFKK